MKIINRTTVAIAFSLRKYHVSGEMLTCGTLNPNQQLEYRIGEPPPPKGNPANHFLRTSGAREEVIPVSDDTTVTFVTDIRTGILS